MSDAVLTAIVGSIAPSLVALGGFYAVYRKTDDLKVHINSKMDLLLKTSGDARFAEGKLAGKQEQKDQ